MKMFGWIFLLIMLPIMALAQVTLPGSASGEVDWALLIGKLIANPQALTASFVGALVVLVIVQALKSETFKGIFKSIPDQVQFLVITVLGQVYAVVLHVTILKDQDISTALVGIFSSGGAAAIFNALRLVFPKWFPKTTKPTLL